MVVLWIKCPYNNSAVIMVLRLGLMALGTLGLVFFNLWVSVVYLGYSVLFNFLFFPSKHCQFCYYAVKETTTDNETGKTIRKLYPKDQWKESCLEKHVTCAKKWAINLYILWFSPIILIIISFFFNFSSIALLSLIGFIGAFVFMFYYIQKKICPNCAIEEECKASF